jgi:hypothetical protein
MGISALLRAEIPINAGEGLIYPLTRRRAEIPINVLTWKRAEIPINMKKG